jgi:hypothetical protein
MHDAPRRRTPPGTSPLGLYIDEHARRRKDYGPPWPPLVAKACLSYLLPRPAGRAGAPRHDPTRVDRLTVLSPLSSPAPRRALGTGLSAAIHLAVLALVIFGLPDLPRLAETETAIPVQIVQLPPPEPAKPDPAIRPPVAEKPPEPPARPLPTLEDVRPDTPEEGGSKAPQEAKRTDDPAEGAKKSDETSAVIGRWLLQPLAVKHTGHPCGDAFESGTLDLIGERGPGQYHGTLKTHVRWTRCAPQVASFYVELRIKGSEVILVGSGFVDTGTVTGDVMSLKDAYGVSVWRRQKVPAPPAKRPTGQR